MTRGGTISFYEQDGLGSVSSVTNSAGTIANAYTYDSFGKTTASTATVANPFGYTGREIDSETGLYFYRRRYYDPSTGKFLSEDPTHFAGGIDFYSYVFNNPQNWIDPFGKQTNSVDSSLLQAIAKGNSAEIEEILKDADEVLSDRAKQLGKDAIQKLRSKAKDWIAKKCKGSVNNEFPRELQEKTLEEIKALSRGKGDLADKAKTAWKLLTDGRFQK
jgi:RHS repeat-associated protein